MDFGEGEDKEQIKVEDDLAKTMKDDPDQHKSYKKLEYIKRILYLEEELEKYKNGAIQPLMVNMAN